MKTLAERVYELEDRVKELENKGPKLVTTKGHWQPRVPPSPYDLNEVGKKMEGRRRKS